MTNPTPSPAQLISEITNAHIVARCVQVLAELGVADALGEAPATAAELAARTDANADALDRILRLTAAHGVFAAVDERYAHTPASRLLRADHPETLRPLVRMRGSPAMWGGMTDLPTVAKTGQPVRDWAALMDHYAANPHESAIFNEAMTAKSLRVVPAVTAAYDFGACAVVADIGGGRGHLLRGILERYPTTRGVLFEVPHVVAELGTLPSRLAVATGDFFVDVLPRADAYVLMDLLHDWSDADAARILAAVRRAAPAHARVLIIETLVAETPGPHVGKTLDITMLTVTGGRERTPTAFGTLLAAAGLKLARVLPTSTQYSIVEAVVA
jgi:hypothetical protein